MPDIEMEDEVAQETRKSAAYRRLNFVFHGAKTKRFHTNDTLTSQTVGEHAFGVAMLIELMAPGCRKELLLAALTHDLAECEVGDVAAPAKRASPTLKAELDKMERTILQNNALYYEAVLTEAERYVLKAADYIDGMMFCARERAMGSRVVCYVYDNFSSYVKQIWDNLPHETHDVYRAAEQMWEQANER